MAAAYESDEILEGLDEIRCFWDPKMSKSYFFRCIRPHLDPILFTRNYSKRLKERIPFYYTYKNLLLAHKIRLRKKGII